MDWQALRAEFPVTRRWAFFDHAAVAPLTGRAQQALHEWAADMAENGDVHDPPLGAARRGGARPGRPAAQRRPARHRLRQEHQRRHRHRRRRASPGSPATTSSPPRRNTPPTSIRG